MLDMAVGKPEKEERDVKDCCVSVNGVHVVELCNERDGIARSVMHALPAWLYLYDKIRFWASIGYNILEQKTILLYLLITGLWLLSPCK